FSAIQTVAPSLRVEAHPYSMRDAGQIERDDAAFAHPGNGGLIITGGQESLLYRDLVISLVPVHIMPAPYFQRICVASGALPCYWNDNSDQYRRAAGYVDRILKGEKPAVLPVQAPTKYELVINAKTAKSHGLENPPTLLARADEVIE